MSKVVRKTLISSSEIDQNNTVVPRSYNAAHSFQNYSEHFETCIGHFKTVQSSPKLVQSNFETVPK